MNFMCLPESGEDAIAFSTQSDYAANVELAPVHKPSPSIEPQAQNKLEKVATPDQHSIEEVCNFLNIKADQVVKTLIVKGTSNSLIALVLRGDHELNAIKAQKLAVVADPLEFASENEIQSQLGCKPGSIGPLNLNCPILIDHCRSSARKFRLWGE